MLKAALERLGRFRTEIRPNARRSFCGFLFALTFEGLKTRGLPHPARKGNTERGALCNYPPYLCFHSRAISPSLYPGLVSRAFLINSPSEGFAVGGAAVGVAVAGAAGAAVAAAA